MRRFVTALVIALSFGFMVVPLAAADSGGLVVTSATVGGQDVASTNWGAPLRLVPGEFVDVELRVANNGNHAVHIRRADLSGRVLGLVFFSYLVPLDVSVAPGATETMHYRLELIGIDDQAIGLMRGDVAVVGDNGDRIAWIPMITDVRGSLLSVYGLFGIGLLVLTVLASVDAGLAIRRHRLSGNRLLRGLRLLTPGVGVGLVLLFTATVLRLWVPRTPVWLVIAAGTAAAFFALGYFTPTPDGQHDADADADVADEDAERDAHIDEADIDEATMGTAAIEDADLGEPILADVDEPALVVTLGDVVNGVVRVNR
jgi:hypothetical protein